MVSAIDINFSHCEWVKTSPPREGGSGRSKGATRFNWVLVMILLEEIYKLLGERGESLARRIRTTRHICIHFCFTTLNNVLVSQKGIKHLEVQNGLV